MDLTVNLTRNEVAHASSPEVTAALFILFGIAVATGPGGPVASGGTVRLVQPWVPDPARLTPVMFTYTV
ncbi:hypothetical protein [Actinorhabdospora filicis]|uniref:hypothetical protein n=1 Tax=Actinorhabdospora filicis TaxID=1785913 RepID=UPI002552A8C9|nr:hypothetical protein [Actinorhabdospora filicis]